MFVFCKWDSPRVALTEAGWSWLVVTVLRYKISALRWSWGSGGGGAPAETETPLSSHCRGDHRCRVQSALIRHQATSPRPHQHHHLHHQEEEEEKKEVCLCWTVNCELSPRVKNVSLADNVLIINIQLLRQSFIRKFLRNSLDVSKHNYFFLNMSDVTGRYQIAGQERERREEREEREERERRKESVRPCSTHRLVRRLTGFTRGETVGLITPLVGPGPAQSSCNIWWQKTCKLGGHLGNSIIWGSVLL